jgi:hypothetical protein
MKQQWFVEYLVEGFEGVKTAGPYESLAAAEEQAADIAGYEGVTNTRCIMKVAPDEA